MLILGTDQRPKTGKGSKEPGSNYNDAGSRSDTMMLWRVGGGASRRLSIPRDTVVADPRLRDEQDQRRLRPGRTGPGDQDGRAVPGVKINHLIVSQPGEFPQVHRRDRRGRRSRPTAASARRSAAASANGGFTLQPARGRTTSTASRRSILARTRENRCNPAENDLTREMRQQAILNAIKSQLFSFHTFLHLPWVAWDAPGAVRTDMGALHAPGDVRRGRARRLGTGQGAEDDRGRAQRC